MKARREYLFNTILLVVFATVMVIFGFTMEFNFGLPMSGPITGLIMGGISLLAALYNFTIYMSDKKREDTKDAKIRALENEIKKLKNK